LLLLVVFTCLTSKLLLIINHLSFIWKGLHAGQCVLSGWQF